MSQFGHKIKMNIVGFLINNVLKLPEPVVTSGPDSLSKMGDVAKKYGLKKVLVVTDAMLVQLGHVKRCTDALEAAGIGFVMYDKVEPNPTSDMVEEGYSVYKEGKCDGIIAFGGGSPMDCAKVIGCKVANPKPVDQYTGGPNKIGNASKYPPLIAVPTTAGTGSETTVAAVITIAKEKKKVFVADGLIIPKEAVLDPKILVGLPKPITAATGMDAMTHAVESYISSIATDATKQLSLRAVEGIFRHLRTAYHHGDDLVAREGMLQASFNAGCAFTKALLGYVHCVAHQFGGLYGTPHGVANAMVLPLVLDHNLKVDTTGSIVEKYCELAFAAGIATRYKTYTQKEKEALARKFVAAIRELEEEMHIPKCVDQLKTEDVRVVSDRAIKEAMDGAPVPCYMSVAEMDALVSSLLPEGQKVPPPRGKL